MNIQSGFNDTEVGARAKGFRVMIEKFQHKACVMIMCMSPIGILTSPIVAEYGLPYQR